MNIFDKLIEIIESPKTMFILGSVAIAAMVISITQEDWKGAIIWGAFAGWDIFEGVRLRREEKR